MCWMRWAALACLLSACSEPTPSTRTLDATIDAHLDRDARLDRDASLDPVDAAPDGGRPDRGVRVDAPPETGCTPPPVRVHDRVAWTRPDAIEIADARHAWPDDARPVHVGAVPDSAPVDAQVFVTLHRPAGCRIDALDDAATLRWQLDLPGARCTGAGLDAAHLYQPVSDPDGHALLVIQRDTGAILNRAPLPAPPTTPAAWGGVAENGGSHWYVGAEAGLMRYTPASGAVETLALDFEARAIAIGSPEHAVVVGARDPAVEGLGDRAQRVRLDGDWMAIGPAFELPGAAWAPPVVLPPCPKFEANGGSHWWCGEGMYALAGDGWSGAWSLRDGRTFFNTDQLDPQVRITGLAVGRDGLVYNGGSHWASGDWMIWTLDPMEARVVAEGTGAPRTCVPSPLLDTDGWLRTRNGAAPVEVRSGAGGMPIGWARAGGDAAGAGRAVRSGCPGGSPERFTRVHRDPAFIRPTAAARLDDDLLIAGTVGRGEETAIWAGRVAPDGVFRWTETIVQRPEVDPQVQAPLVVKPVRESELQMLLPGDFLTVIGLTDEGALRGVSRIADNGVGRVVTTASIGPPDFIIAGVYRDAAEGEPQHWIFPYRNGFIDVEVPMRADEPLTPQAVATLAPGWVIGALSPSGGVVRAVDAEGAQRWAIPLAVEGAEAKVVDVAVTSDERVFALIAETTADGPITRLLVADGETGQILADSRVEGAEPSRVALDPDGRGHYVTSDLRVGRVLPTGALLAPAPLAEAGRSVALVRFGADAFLVGRDAANDVVLARIDSDGRGSCEAAGRCVLTDGCPIADDACAIATCQPRDGTCADAPLPDGAACGPALTCTAGACQP